MTPNEAHTDDLATDDLMPDDLMTDGLTTDDADAPTGERFVDLWDMEFVDGEQDGATDDPPRRRAADAETSRVELAVDVTPEQLDDLESAPERDDSIEHDGPFDAEVVDTEVVDTGIVDAVESDRGWSSDDEVMSKREPSKRRFWQRTGGVAPMIEPPGRFARFVAARRWSRTGFVPMTPRTQKLRHRILPRTVIGISTMFMAAGIGAAFSGAAFYAYYDDRLAENEAEVSRFVDGFDEQFTTATGTLDQLRLDSIEEIRDELDPLGDYVSDRNGVVELPALAGSAVWSVETIDEDGKPVVGSAFAVTGHEGGTALVTSLSVVRSATLEPSPSITIVKGPIRNEATLWSWDEEHDLALIVVEEELAMLDLAGTSAQLRSVGGRVFAMSGTGSQGATASPGVLLDQSAFGVQHTAVTGDLFIGGPILDSEGLVVGVVTGDYVPLGVDPGAVSLMPDVPSICSRVLRCPSSDELVIGEIIVGDVTGGDADG